MSSWLLLQVMTGTVVSGCVAGYLLGHWDMSHPIVAAAILLSAPMILIGRRLGFQHRVATAARLICRRHVVEDIEAWVGPLEGEVFVAGLLRPRIFIDHEVLDRLDRAERRAVMLHERAHQVAYDPARRAVLDGWGNILRRLPYGSVLVERAIARNEIRADRVAIADGVSRRVLASALMKIAGVRPGLTGYATASDLRLRALLDDEAPLPDLHTVGGRIICVLHIAVIAGVLILHHLVLTRTVPL